MKTVTATEYTDTSGARTWTYNDELSYVVASISEEDGGYTSRTYEGRHTYRHRTFETAAEIVNRQLTARGYQMREPAGTLTP